MARNRAGRDIWYEGRFPIRTEGVIHLFLAVSVSLALGLGGGWLIEQRQPISQLLGLAALIAFPIWGIVNLIVAYRHSGPWGSSWKN